MIAIPAAVQIHLCTTPTDMRKSFDGLAALATTHLQQQPLSGNLFLFVNRRRDRLKILYWDNDGLAIWYKRLERGSFPVPRSDPDQPGCTLTASQLSLLLAGIDLKTAPQQERYQRPDANR